MQKQALFDTLYVHNDHAWWNYVHSTRTNRSVLILFRGKPPVTSNICRMIFSTVLLAGTVSILGRMLTKIHKRPKALVGAIINRPAVQSTNSPQLLANTKHITARAVNNRPYVPDCKISLLRQHSPRKVTQEKKHLKQSPTRQKMRVGDSVHYAAGARVSSETVSAGTASAGAAYLSGFRAISRYMASRSIFACAR